MKPPAKHLTVWVAQGFGVGRLRGAPGTWGSLLGLAWLAALLWPGRADLFLLGCLAGIALAVPLCGQAEQILQHKDPASVVLDEIVSIPLCYAGVLLAGIQPSDPPLRLHSLLHGPGLAYLVGGFVLFRILDALKPPPIRALQHLVGGWGVVCDDVAAGLLTGATLLAARLLLG